MRRGKEGTPHREKKRKGEKCEDENMKGKTRH